MSSDMPLMTTNSVPGKSWYLVYTKPRQEEVAATNLTRQGYGRQTDLLGMTAHIAL